MKSSRLLFALFLSALFLTMIVRPAVAKTVKVPPPVDTRIMIKAVDVKAKTVAFKFMRDAKQPDHVYTVGEITAVTVNNQPGKISDIKVGMVVDKYLEMDTDNLESLDVSGYPTDPTTAKPKPKAKAPAKPKPAPTQ